MSDEYFISPFLWFIGMGAVAGLAIAQVQIRHGYAEKLYSRGAILFFALAAIEADNWFQAVAYALCPLGALHVTRTLTVWIDEHWPLFRYDGDGR